MKIIKKISATTLLATALFSISTKVSAQVCDITFSLADNIALVGAVYAGFGCGCYGNIEDDCAQTHFGYKFNHPSIPRTANGCGVEDGIEAPVQRVGNVELRPCCDQHDFDYQDCQKGKAVSGC